MEEILKKINSDILTESVVAELKEAFDSAVTAKVDEFKKTEMLSETEKILDKYDAKFEEFKAELLESKEKELEEYKSDLVEALDSYLDVVVEEFLAENKVAMEDEVAIEKSKTVLEAFDAILVTAGVDVQKIVEAKEAAEDEVNESTEAKLVDMEERFNKLMEEKKELEAKNAEMLEIGIKAEMCEGLTVVQKEKFNKLAEIVEMGEDKEAFVSKLEAIKESVLGEKVVAESKKEDNKEDKVITESKDVEQVVVDSSRFF